MREDDFDPDRFRIDHTDPRYTQKADRVPRRIQKRREQFVMLPWWWAERLIRSSDAIFPCNWCSANCFDASAGTQATNSHAECKQRFSY